MLRTEPRCIDKCKDIQRIWDNNGYANVQVCTGAEKNRYPDVWPAPVPPEFNATRDAPECRQDSDPTVQSTMLFNTFVFMQLFNEINVRRLDNKPNCFENFFSNYMFLGVIFVTCGLQILFVEAGGRALNVVRLRWDSWLICLAFGAGALIWGTLCRVFVPPPRFKWLSNGKPEEPEEVEIELP